MRAAGSRSALGCAWLLAAAVCLCATQPLAARENDDREFSLEEQAALRAGKLVVRSERRTRGAAHLTGGLAWQLVDADQDTVWKALSDVAAYPHFLPAVVLARRLDRVGDEQRLFIKHHTLLIDSSYCVLSRSNSERRIFSFRLDHSRPADIDDAWGEIRVSAFSPRRSVVSLAIMADLGSGLIARLLRAEVSEWMLRIPAQLKRYVERENHGQP